MRNVKVGMLFCIALLLVFSLSFTAIAASVQPVYYAGNDNEQNDELNAATAGTTKFKIDPPQSGTYNDGTIELIVTFDGLGSVDFSVSSLVEGKCYAIKHVFVKGSNGGNLYTYPTPVVSDNDLVAPINDNNGNNYDISHVSFFYVEVDCLNDTCYTYSTETAWGAGERINSKGNWATYSQGEGSSILMAGQHIEVGTVTTTLNGDGTVTVTYNVDDNVKINEVHLYVGDVAPNHAKPGQYAHKATGLDQNTFEFTVDFNGENLFVAAHAVVTIATEVPCEQ